MKPNDELHYPPSSLVLIAGLPGAGKTTFLARLFQLRGDESHPQVVHGVHVIDSQQSRNWWARHLRFLHPRARTPVTHSTHIWRITRAVFSGHNVVAHTRGTWAHVLYGFAALARLRGTRVHLVLLDVPPQTARAGQHARGRTVTEVTFRRHCRRWRALLDRARDGKLTAAASVTVLDRNLADVIRGIRFTAAKTARTPESRQAQQSCEDPIVLTRTG